MKKIINKYLPLTFNIIVGFIVVITAVSIATIALTKKVNETNANYNQNITATVVKQSVTILSLTDGVIEKVYVKTGDEVKKGDVLVRMSNSSLQDKIRVYEQFQNNVSAQTEANLSKLDLNNLTVYAPIDGIIGEVSATDGSSVSQFTKLMTIYSSNGIRLLANLTEGQYQSLQNSHEILAYSDRLSQSFQITPTILRPDEQSSLNNSYGKKIGLYFEFNNPKDGVSLLNNEDLKLQFGNKQEGAQKPIDFFVNFWNGLLSRPAK